jgi:hypothetical protein
MSKKRYASLIEVLIAMVLTVLVLMTLMFFYRQTTSINSEIEKVKTEHFRLRFVEKRLSDVLTRTISDKGKKTDFLFFSLNDEGLGLPGSQSLIFTFNNGVSKDKAFSNDVVGRLYLDQQKRLILAYWPLPKRWEGSSQLPMKKETLLEGVESLGFEFFIPPEKAGEASLKKNAASEAPAPEPKGAWRRQLWLRDFQKLPAMVKVDITFSEGKHGKQEMTFAYPLVNGQSHVIYD